MSHHEGEGRRRIGAALWLGCGVGLREQPSGRDETGPASYGGGPTCESKIELMHGLAGRKGEKGEAEPLEPEVREGGASRVGLRAE